MPVDDFESLDWQQGATGTRLVITPLYELRRRKKKYGLATACIGGGQGIAMVVESMN